MDHVLLVLFFYHCIYDCMFCMLIFNFVNYVFYCFVYLFLLLYMCYSVYSASLWCSVLFFMCHCVLYCCHRVPTQLQLTNVSYHISSHISYRNYHIVYIVSVGCSMSVCEQYVTVDGQKDLKCLLLPEFSIYIYIYICMGVCVCV